MSDIKLYNLKKQKISSFSKPSIEKMRSVIKTSGDILLGIKVLGFDILLSEDDNLVIDTLAVDENYCLTIIEYRLGRFSQTINKGLLIIDYIKHNQGKVRLLLNEMIGYEEAKEISLDARLISLSDDFNKYDEFAVKQMLPEIDLIKFNFFDNDALILEKVYQGKKIVMDDFDMSLISSEQRAVFKEVSEYLLSLGDEVVQRGFSNYICFRKIKSLAYLFFDGGITLQLKLKDKYKAYKIKTSKDLAKLTMVIEDSYDEA